MYDEKYSSCRHLAHPLLQVQAAEQFFGHVDAFVSDVWHEIYEDEPPDAGEIYDAVSPGELLDVLRALGLRFDLAASPPTEVALEGFWTRRFGSTTDILLYKWAYAVLDEVAIDVRAFEHGLQATNLIFVEDTEEVVGRACELFEEGVSVRSAILERFKALEEQGASKLRSKGQDRKPEDESA
jgi:hypothetical protein